MQISDQLLALDEMIGRGSGDENEVSVIWLASHAVDHLSMFLFDWILRLE